MKAISICMAALAVCCASGARAQTDTAGGATPALTQDTAGTGVPAAPVTATDTAGLGAATTTTTAADTSFTTTAAPVMSEDTAITTTTTNASETRTEEREGGFDWNWLGLLGLLGLTGLFKKRHTEVVHHDTVRPRV